MPSDLLCTCAYDLSSRRIHNNDCILHKIREEQRQTVVDLINHPAHYTFGRFEVIDVLEDWFSDDPLLWQTVKYLARAKHKDNFLQDLKKAQFYLNRRIESEEK